MNNGSSWRTTAAKTGPQTRQEGLDCYTPLGHWGRIALRREQCDVFDWRPTLLGNRSRNSSMDTVTTPVLLRYMVTNSRIASVSIVAGSVKEGKTIHRVSPRPSAFGDNQLVSLWDQSESVWQSVLEVRRQCSAVPTAGFKKPPVLMCSQ
jgi:hypothetical protein